MALSAAPIRVMVVEDDPTSRNYLRLVLSKNQYEVISAESVADAQRKLEEKEPHSFGCVITDYRMPEHDGLELVHWLKDKAPCIATIVLTAEGEKNLVTEFLRSGAVDFLDKPVEPAKLLESIRRAVAQTQRQWSLSMSQSAVQKLGRAQLWMVQASQAPNNNGSGFYLDVCYHPKLEAGGDFFSHFKAAASSNCFLLTDVSGHDLQAAYISAYFQGIVRGMLLKTTKIPEIFDYFNHFLYTEWNQLEGNTIETSLAAAAVMVNTQPLTADVYISGAPPPVYAAPDGRLKKMGVKCGAPLGWFSDLDLYGESLHVEESGIIYLWTDGLEDFAQDQNIHPLCMGFILLQAREKKRQAPELNCAQDDILFASVRLPSGGTGHSRFLPLFEAQYQGNQKDEIDSLSEIWRRNLKAALPNLGDSVEYNVILCCREALLNAMIHGCGNEAHSSLQFQMSYDESRDVIGVWVDDPGPGHHFDICSHMLATCNDIVEEHRGLIFIKNLASSVRFERNGARLIVEFSIPDLNAVQTSGYDV